MPRKTKITLIAITLVATAIIITSVILIVKILNEPEEVADTQVPIQASEPTTIPDPTPIVEEEESEYDIDSLVAKYGYTNTIQHIPLDDNRTLIIPAEESKDSVKPWISDSSIIPTLPVTPVTESTETVEKVVSIYDTKTKISLKEDDAELFKLFSDFLKEKHEIDVTDIFWEDIYSSNGNVNIYRVLYEGGICYVGQRESDEALCFMQSASDYSANILFVDSTDFDKPILPKRELSSEDKTDVDFAIAIYTNEDIPNQVIHVFNEIVEKYNYTEAELQGSSASTDTSEYSEMYRFLFNKEYNYLIYFDENANYAYAEKL